MTSASQPMSPFADRVLAVLSQYTVFSWPVLRAQCERANLPPSELTAADLPRLIPLLSAGVARFTSPVKGEQVRRELEQLLNSR